MNRRPRVAVAGAVLAATLLCAGPSPGQESEADRRATIKRIAGYAALIDKTEVEIQHKQWEHRILLSLVLVVGILGATSAAVQKFEGTRARVSTLVMGVVISAVTFATNTLFSDDHRALRRNIDRARHERELGKVVAESADLSASGEALLQLEQQVQARYAAIIGALGPDSKRASLAPSTAWAAAPGAQQSAECARWPAAGSLCFSGVGRSTYPDQARQNALQGAVGQASQYLARQGGGRRPAESFREYVERFARVEEVYPNKELRTGREFGYVAILTLNPRFADARALSVSNTEPRTIAAGDLVLIHGWRPPGAVSSSAAATSEAWLRIEDRDVKADRGADAASSWVFGKRGGSRGPLQSGDLVSLRGVWGDPYVNAEPDGRLVAFRGPAEATLFRLDKRAGSPAEVIREGDAFSLVDSRTGRAIRAERGRIIMGPPEDGAATRFASVLVPRLGSAGK
ncbi:MAG TPA: hypothetical protein VHF87_09820 [Methylomirabilota bacterium]|jgi:hypothetical protein|nr:hypothetical protein [Methylomirabilota bacterium]